MMKQHFLGRGALALAACFALAVACSDDEGGDDTGAGGSAGSAGSGAGTGGGSGGSASGAGGGGGSSTAGSAGSGTAGSAGSSGSAGSAGSAGSSGDEPDAGDPGDAGDAGDDIQASVTYTDDIQPILAANCSPCHAGEGEGGHDAAINYDDAVDVASDILDEIESGGMPESGSGNIGCDGGDPGDPGCVSAEDFALIQQWVQDGTPE